MMWLLTLGCVLEPYPSHFARFEPAELPEGELVMGVTGQGDFLVRDTTTLAWTLLDAAGGAYPIEGGDAEVVLHVEVTAEGVVRSLSRADGAFALEVSDDRGASWTDISPAGLSVAGNFGVGGDGRLHILVAGEPYEAWTSGNGGRTWSHARVNVPRGTTYGPIDGWWIVAEPEGYHAWQAPGGRVLDLPLMTAAAVGAVDLGPGMVGYPVEHPWAAADPYTAFDAVSLVWAGRYHPDMSKTGWGVLRVPSPLARLNPTFLDVRDASGRVWLDVEGEPWRSVEPVTATDGVRGELLRGPGCDERYWLDHDFTQRMDRDEVDAGGGYQTFTVENRSDVTLRIYDTNGGGWASRMDDVPPGETGELYTIFGVYVMAEDADGVCYGVDRLDAAAKHVTFGPL